MFSVYLLQVVFWETIRVLGEKRALGRMSGRKTYRPQRHVRVAEIVTDDEGNIREVPLREAPRTQEQGWRAGGPVRATLHLDDGYQQVTVELPDDWWRHFMPDQSETASTPGPEPEEERLTDIEEILLLSSDDEQPVRRPPATPPPATHLNWADTPVSPEARESYEAEVELHEYLQTTDGDTSADSSIQEVPITPPEPLAAVVTAAAATALAAAAAVEVMELDEPIEEPGEATRASEQGAAAASSEREEEAGQRPTSESQSAPLVQEPIDSAATTSRRKRRRRNRNRSRFPR